MQHLPTRLLGLLLVLSLPCNGVAADRVVSAGGTLTLTEDLVLASTDRLEVLGTPEKPCTIEGGHFRIRSEGNWTGRIKLAHCKVRRLGHEQSVVGDRLKSGYSALEVTVAGSGAVIVDDCRFDRCNTVRIRNDGESTTHFRRNELLPNSTVSVNKAAHLSALAFSADGGSKAQKTFEANRVYRGGCHFSASSWVVDDNLFIGYRCGVTVSGEKATFRGNYVHVDLSIGEEFPYWSQVSTFGGTCLAEDNVIRAGHWVLRGLGGEFRHNLVLEAHGHNLLQAGTAKVHHNIFAHPCPLPDSKMNPRPIGGLSAVHQVYPQDRLELYNNTFHGPGLGVALELSPNTLLPVLRNNVFHDFRTETVVFAHRPKGSEKAGRIGHADYNCFFCPKVPGAVFYGAAVEGKTQRRDAGFALNDLPRGGRINEQVDPKFKGPIPEQFPFRDEDIKAGKVTVIRMLKFYRDAFTPTPGSPLIDAGDPADGEGTDIGAVAANKQ